jgi:hypothetical protein
LPSEEASEDDEDVSPSFPVLRKRKKMIKTTNDKLQSFRKTSVDDIPTAAKIILHTLSQCKKIVKYIKKVDVMTLPSIMLAMTSVLASFSLFPLFLSYRHVLAMTQVITFVCVHFFLSHDA